MNRVLARPAIVVATLSLVVCGLLGATAGAAHAVVGSVTQALYVANLTPCCGNPEPDASGVAQSNTLTKAGGGQAEIFTTTVTRTSEGSGGPSADIRVVLSRGGQPYAECFLIRVPDEDSANTGDTQTFLVTIVKVVFSSGTIFKQLAGSCDVNLATSGIQPGVPAVLTGDVATAVKVVDSVATEFLSGIFVQP